MTHPTPALILTPTQRLARAWRQSELAERRAAGETAWRSTPVIHLDAWRNELQRQAVARGRIDQVPIGPAQARVLWRQVIDTEVFTGEPRVHRLAECAWRTLHEFQLEAPEHWTEALLSEDSRRFRDWAARFSKLCDRHGVIDEWRFAARLPELIRAGAFDLPTRIELRGFDLAPAPLLEAVLDACVEAGCDVAGRPDAPPPELESGLPLHVFQEPDAELHTAARWARAQVEAGGADQPIAVVVPDLSRRLERVERIFRQVFDPPGAALTAREHEPWHLSMAPKLARWPLIADALLVLGLDPERITHPDAGRVLASPYLVEASTHARARAGARALLAREAPYEITSFELFSVCRRAGAEPLAGALEKWRAFRHEQRGGAFASEWVERFLEELRILGFGHGRTLDSREFQALRRWQDLLESFATADVVLDHPISRGQALSMLTERASSEGFRERNPGCPVEILGVEEALGARFEAVWITTLDAATWPGPIRRDPLIPGPVQNGRVPGASAAGVLDHGRRQLDALLALSESPQLSFATGTDEIPLAPTPLLERPELIAAESEAPAESVPLEDLGDDAQAPPLENHAPGGGTALLRDQAACPFRAWARHRLGARSLDVPRPGLDAAARGQLVHAALEGFWRGVKNHAALRALDDDALEARIDIAVSEALGALTQRHRRLLSPAGQRLEQRRLIELLRRWLVLELQRGEFRIEALERPVRLEFGGLVLSGKIDRVDLTPVGAVLIDYKTGAAGRNGWTPDPRLDDPQLPAYLLSMQPRPAGVAFGRLRPEDPGFEGLAETDPGIPGVSPLEQARGKWRELTDWGELLEQWRESLDGLGEAFIAGRAEVNPKRPDTCRYCDLHALCRIHERSLNLEQHEERA